MRTLLLAVVLILAGCPPTEPAAVPATCVKHGEKCKTAAGPLGVCDTIECRPGDRGPCFKCMPQH